MPIHRKLYKSCSNTANEREERLCFVCPRILNPMLKREKWFSENERAEGIRAENRWRLLRLHPHRVGGSCRGYCGFSVCQQRRAHCCSRSRSAPESVAVRVSNLLTRSGHTRGETLLLTGGLCDSPYFIKVLSEKTGCNVMTHSLGRYAGALGAALISAKQTGERICL